eukprot:Nk52_evm8s327 gene=Nk52_evmTU8s327
MSSPGADKDKKTPEQKDIESTNELLLSDNDNDRESGSDSEGAPSRARSRRIVGAGVSIDPLTQSRRSSIASLASEQQERGAGEDGIAREYNNHDYEHDKGDIIKNEGFSSHNKSDYSIHSLAFAEGERRSTLAGGPHPPEYHAEFGEQDGDQPWYHRGLWRKPELLIEWNDDLTRGKSVCGIERKVTWTELFGDLVLVTVINAMASDLRHQIEHGGDSVTTAVLNYVLKFLMLYVTWLFSTMYSTWLLTDDLFHKLMNAFYMAGIVGAGMFVTESPNGKNGGGLAVCLGFSILIPCLMVLRVMKYIPRFRTFGVTILMTFAPVVVILFCAPLVEDRSKPYVFLAALLWKYVGAFFPMAIPVRKRVPIHLAHFTERIGLLMIIVIGESVFALAINNSNKDTMMFLAAGLGFLIIFSMKMLYFDVDIVDEDNHAMRRSFIGAAFWVHSHGSLATCSTLFASGLELILVSFEEVPEATTEHSLNETDATGELHRRVGALLTSEAHSLKSLGTSSDVRYLTGMGFAGFLFFLLVARFLHSQCTQVQRQSHTLDSMEEGKGTLCKRTLSHNEKMQNRILAMQVIFQLVAIGTSIGVSLIDGEKLNKTLFLGILAILSFKLVVVNLIDEYLAYGMKPAWKQVQEEQQRKNA